MENEMSQTTVAGPSLETVLYEKRGGFAYITMNRPKVLNALNRQSLVDLRAALQDAKDDPEVRGAIITGAGEKAFIAGADINEVATDTPVEAEQKTRAGQSVMDLIESWANPSSQPSTVSLSVGAARPRWRAQFASPRKMPGSVCPK
jgi:1,4-dihydroxy-2-naphthoyl-CoA synthase